MLPASDSTLYAEVDEMITVLVTKYPMHWQGVNSGATPEFSKLYHAVCRLHELIRNVYGQSHSSSIFFLFSKS